MIPKRPDFLSAGRFIASKFLGARSLIPPGIESLLTWILMVLFSVLIVLGGFALALQESRINNGERLSRATTLTLPATENNQVYQATYTDVSGILTLTSIAIVPSTSITLIPASPTFTKTPYFTMTITFTPIQTDCPPPGLFSNTEWMTITVNPGDTLTNLALIYGSTPEVLVNANCLMDDQLVPGTTLYVPVILPTFTPTMISCGPPTGWVYYRVQPGDTLFRLSQVFGVSVWQLQQANCLGNSTIIRAGQLIYVPYWLPIPTPIFFGTLTATTTPIVTSTPIPSFTAIPPTLVPSTSPTMILSPTKTTTPLPSCTPSPTNIPTNVPTDSPTPSQTPTPGESD
jgi:LysM repeat protein